MARRRGRLEGPILLAWAALGLAVGLAATSIARGTGEAGVRAGIRATAATSLALFVVAFAASGLHRLVRRPATAWALRNRRWIGLSMALSHAVHLAAIALLVRRWPAAGAAIAPATRVAGSLGVLALAALVATSNDRAVTKLGAGRWRALQRGACWILWLVFVLSYAPGGTANAAHALAAAVLVAVAALRFHSRFRPLPISRGT